MRLSWNEVRARAAKFAREHADDKDERSQSQRFWIDFFDIFGLDSRRVTTFEKRVQQLDATKRGFIDLYWPGTLIIEQKSAGRDLLAATKQALDYFDWLSEKDRPQYLLVCDFQRFQLTDLRDAREWKFHLSDLPKHVEAFAFILGAQPRFFRNQSKASIAASELMGRLHEALAESGYTGHDLERLLVRLLFCLFADDTGIFEPKDLLINLIEQRTSADGRDLGRWLNELFDVLNTPEEQRQKDLDPDLAAFPYINGGLFEGRIRTPSFNNAMRDMLLDACAFDWGEVSPAIFGSLFQSVMDAKARRAKGAHYTTEQSILKVIEPLFLDDLRAELERILARKDGGRQAALKAYHDKLASLTFFDPACGCGNFLVIAYRELRELERRLLKETLAGTLISGSGVSAAAFSRVNVDQFFGIEYEEFRILTEATLWEFGILTSAMHMAWTSFIGGRLKSDFQYGIGINYNTFPWPKADEAQMRKVEALAQTVLDERAKHTLATLADLYDPDTMPPGLRTAHAKLDAAVDRLYRATPFPSDRARAEHLLALYEASLGALPLNGPAPKSRRKKAAAPA